MKQKENISIINFINKFLLCTLLFLFLAILSKSNIDYKEKIKTTLYRTNINFSYFKDIYNKYLGGVTMVKNNNKVEQVFDEKINYSKITEYKEGIKLEVSNKYLVPNIEKGIVVFLGSQENYNNSIIIENKEGIDILYGNICNSNLKLYDNIDKGTIIGESCDNYIYVVLKKGNNIIDYKKYIS